MLGKLLLWMIAQVLSLGTAPGVQLPEVSSSEQDALPLHGQSADRKAVLPFISSVCLGAREVAVLRDI